MDGLLSGGGLKPGGLKSGILQYLQQFFVEVFDLLMQNQPIPLCFN